MGGGSYMERWGCEGMLAGRMRLRRSLAFRDIRILSQHLGEVRLEKRLLETEPF